MKRLFKRFPSFIISAMALALSMNANASKTPNIVFIFADDQGYGDVQSYSPETSKIATPAADKLASEGVRFTDAHSGAAVCTPTRYGLLTGRYSWRTRLQRHVVQGFAPNMISEGRPTVASFLQDHGYHTAIIGKWHLNFQYQDPSTGSTLTREDVHDKGNLAPIGSIIPDGPVTRGFNYFHGFHHAGDMRGIIENNHVIAHDDVMNMLPRITSKSVEYIESRAEHPDQPFFLYVPLGSPHTPIVPTPEWQGKSGLGKYGDFVMQNDHCLAEIMRALERNGFSDNTLLIFTSDNGASKAAGIQELAKKGHLVSAHLRGSKADLWEGGHRVPFIARWPGEIQHGSVSDELICLTDFFSTVADILGESIPDGSCEDSESFLSSFYGKPVITKRKGIIHHSIDGHFAYREGNWKLLLARGSGGWTSPTEQQMSEDSPKAQLYDLENDPSETTNLYVTHPEIAQRLLSQLETYVFEGRSTPGPKSLNDTDEIVLWKGAVRVEQWAPARAETLNASEPRIDSNADSR